jgi:hypothetical protein
MWEALFSIAQAVTAAPENPPQLTVSGNDEARLQWVRTIASPNDDWINDLVLLRNGNIAAAGFLNRRDEPPSDWSAVLAEVTPGGALVRQSRYGEGSGTDAFFGLSEAVDGSRVLAGFTTRIGQGGIDAWTLVARADGSMVNEEAHGGAGYDRFTDVAEAADGWVFLGHSQAEHSDKRRIFLVKTDRSGRKLWERVHDAAESWGALYIEPAPGGGFIVAGGTSADGDADMFAMKVAEDGSELWRKRAGTADWNEINHGLVVRPNGEIVLVGYSNKGGGANDVVAATLRPDGELIRLERWGGAADDRAILARAGAGGRARVETTPSSLRSARTAHSKDRLRSSEGLPMIEGPLSCRSRTAHSLSQATADRWARAERTPSSGGCRCPPAERIRASAGRLSKRARGVRRDRASRAAPRGPLPRRGSARASADRHCRSRPARSGG